MAQLLVLPVANRLVRLELGLDFPPPLVDNGTASVASAVPPGVLACAGAFDVNRVVARFEVGEPQSSRVFLD